MERYKQRDMLEQVLREMTGSFPSLSRVFVEERDLFMAKQLREICKRLNEDDEGALITLN